MPTQTQFDDTPPRGLPRRGASSDPAASSRRTAAVRCGNPARPTTGSPACNQTGPPPHSPGSPPTGTPATPHTADEPATPARRRTPHRPEPGPVSLTVPRTKHDVHNRFGHAVCRDPRSPDSLHHTKHIAHRRRHESTQAGAAASTSQATTVSISRICPTTTRPAPQNHAGTSTTHTPDQAWAPAARAGAHTSKRRLVRRSL
jgi:hypothetical protein